MKKNIIIITLVIWLILFLGFKLFNIYKENVSLVFMNYDGFEIEGDTIIKYNKSGGNIVIPSSVNGVVITTIADYAFYDLDIENVSIPNTIISIGDYAFANNNISNLEIPSSVNTLGEGAFIHNSINTLIIDEFTLVGNACFNDNKLKMSDAFFYNSSGELISYGGEVKGNITISDELSVIGEKAFYDTGIISITLSDSVTDIKDLAFADNYLVEVLLPDSINFISNNAFENNLYLIDIFIDKEVNSILNYPWGATDSQVYWSKK